MIRCGLTGSLEPPGQFDGEEDVARLGGGVDFQQAVAGAFAAEVQVGQVEPAAVAVVARRHVDDAAVLGRQQHPCHRHKKTKQNKTNNPKISFTLRRSP